MYCLPKTCGQKQALNWAKSHCQSPQNHADFQGTKSSLFHPPNQKVKMTHQVWNPKRKCDCKKRWKNDVNKNEEKEISAQCLKITKKSPFTTLRAKRTPHEQRCSLRSQSCKMRYFKWFSTTVISYSVCPGIDNTTSEVFSLQIVIILSVVAAAKNSRNGLNLTQIKSLERVRQKCVTSRPWCLDVAPEETGESHMINLLADMDKSLDSWTKITCKTLNSCMLFEAKNAPVSASQMIICASSDPVQIVRPLWKKKMNLEKWK